MYEVSVYNVIREPLTSRYLMMLDAVDSLENSVLIPIGKNEAENIHSMKCSGGCCKGSPFDILSPILSSMPDVSLEKLVIKDCTCGVYRANLHMTADGEKKVIDCRPSDGVALAMTRGLPIFVEKVADCCDEEQPAD